MASWFLIHQYTLLSGLHSSLTKAVAQLPPPKTPIFMLLLMPKVKKIKSEDKQ
jgi:hypothetical protein